MGPIPPANLGTLFICPTPIGNLEDITLRVLRVLQEVDLIAAENTRHTQKLLSHFNIKKKLVSYYDSGNPETKERKLLQMLKEGKSVALVSSAGTPLVSDPGYDLIRGCILAQIPVVSLPGPSALVTALAGSGIAPHPFYFGGFLPSKSNARKTALKKVRDFPFTLIYFEAPHRIQDNLGDCLEILGDRKGAVARELTKIHEEFIHGKLSDLIERFKQSPPRGEMTLMMEGKPLTPVNPEALEGEIRSLLENGVSIPEASRQLAGKYELSKNKLYALAHRLFR